MDRVCFPACLGSRSPGQDGGRDRATAIHGNPNGVLDLVRFVALLVDLFCWTLSELEI